MKVTNIVCYFAKGLFYVKVETDEGVSGFGECSPMQVDAILPIIQTVIKPQVIGQSVFDLEKIEESIMRKSYKISGQLLAMAFSGVEIALWDAKARFLKRPLYNLLGGKYRAEIPLYGSSMSRDLAPEEEAAKLLEGIRQFDFKAVKIKVGPLRLRTAGRSECGRLEGQNRKGSDWAGLPLDGGWQQLLYVHSGCTAL